jgi:hypothetical protein
LPSYLLQNDGHANFADVTDAAGLGPKRWRRIYSASLADLNGDDHLDLVVVSDFAGLDIYQNDGSGHFKDVTRQSVAEPHGFGMAHALADFNAMAGRSVDDRNALANRGPLGTLGLRRPTRLKIT